MANKAILGKVIKNTFFRNFFGEYPQKGSPSQLENGIIWFMVCTVRGDSAGALGGYPFGRNCTTPKQKFKHMMYTSAKIFARSPDNNFWPIWEVFILQDEATIDKLVESMWLNHTSWFCGSDPKWFSSVLDQIDILYASPEEKLGEAKGMFSKLIKSLKSVSGREDQGRNALNWNMFPRLLEAAVRAEEKELGNVGIALLEAETQQEAQKATKSQNEESWLNQWKTSMDEMAAYYPSLNVKTSVQAPYLVVEEGVTSNEIKNPPDSKEGYSYATNMESVVDLVVYSDSSFSTYPHLLEAVKGVFFHESGKVKSPRGSVPEVLVPLLSKVKEMPIPPQFIHIAYYRLVVAVIGELFTHFKVTVDEQFVETVRQYGIDGINKLFSHLLEE